MAKHQTRRSVSVNRSVFTRLQAFAVKHGLPAAQVAEQGIEAILAGRVPLGPRVKPVRERGVFRGRFARIDVDGPDVIEPPRREQPAVFGGTCAVCTNPLGDNPERPGAMQPIGRGGALVRVCYSCNHEPVSSGRYSFGGGSRGGLGEGNRQVAARGLGK